MKKVTSLSLLALLTAVGCGTMGTKKHDPVVTTQVSSDAMHEYVKPFEHPYTRTPSSELVGKPVYSWEADTLKIPVTAGATINQVFNVKFNQYSTYTMNENVTRNVQREVTTWQTVSNPVIVCDEKQGAGKSAYWDAFYAAPAKSKPAKLGDAIMGVGEASAKKLIAAGYFHSKPRSWKEFQADIQSAKDAKVIEPTVAYQVLYKYRQDNMQKLGYNTQDTGVCTLVIEQFEVPEQRMVTVQETHVEAVPHKDLIGSETKQYPISISGQKLQAFETDMLVFSFNHDTNQVSLAQAAYNNYSISFQGHKLVVVGTQRRHIPLPDDVIAPGATLEASNGMAGFTALFNAQYIPKSAADGQLLVSIQVHSCKKGLIGSVCSVFNRDEQVQPTTVEQVTSSIVKHSFARAPGRIYWVHYWVNTSNSPWYGNNVVSSSHNPSL